jgi:hypothetical protein
MIVLALACVIWLEVLYMPFAFVDTEIVHEGVDIFTEALRDCKRTYEWFCQFGAKMFGAIGCRIGSFPNQITHRIFNFPTLRIVVPFRSIPVSVNAPLPRAVLCPTWTPSLVPQVGLLPHRRPAIPASFAVHVPCRGLSFRFRNLKGTESVW